MSRKHYMFKYKVKRKHGKGSNIYIARGRAQIGTIAQDGKMQRQPGRAPGRCELAPGRSNLAEADAEAKACATAEAEAKAESKANANA